MEKPFLFIEYKTTEREEFEITEGRQPTLALFYLKRGSFKLKLSGGEYTVKEQDCVIFADDVDFFRTVIEPISFIYLKFMINPKCPFKVDIPNGIIKFKNKKRFLDSIEKYEKLTEAQSPSSVYYREHLLEDILLQAFAEYQSQALIQDHNGMIDYEIEHCKDTLAKHAAQYITAHISEKITIKNICNAVNTNPSTLNFKIRKSFSVSTAVLIEKIKMNYARTLLRNTTFSVGEVAEKCGFDNIYYFSTVFRKNHLLSPTEFRKLYR